MKPPIITPEINNVVFEPFPKSFANNKVKATVPNPKIKAKKLIKTLGKVKTIAIAAPKPEPLLTPNKSGEVNLFLKISLLY